MAWHDRISDADAAIQKAMKWFVKLAELILLTVAFQVIAITTGSASIQLFSLILLGILLFYAIGPLTSGTASFMSTIRVKSRWLFWVIAIAYLCLIVKVGIDLQNNLVELVRTFAEATAGQPQNKRLN